VFVFRHAAGEPRLTVLTTVLGGVVCHGEPPTVD
jgi:hypothetical protein